MAEEEAGGAVCAGCQEEYSSAWQRASRAAGYSVRRQNVLFVVEKKHVREQEKDGKYGGTGVVSFLPAWRHDKSLMQAL